MIPPYTQGRLHIISGPVYSGKTGRVVSRLNSLYDGGALNGKDTLLVKHPKDDKGNKGKIGKYEAFESEDVDKIFERVNERIDTVFISGISHYDKGMIKLVDALVRGNRNVIATGINLDYSGNPYGIMPDIMAIADDVEVVNAECSGHGCENPGVMSYNEGERYYPSCYYHFAAMKNLDLELKSGGLLELHVGSMYAGKTEEMQDQIKRTRIRGEPFVVFKYSSDTKGGDKILKHSGGTIDATLIRNGEEILEFLGSRNYINREFLDEVQFIPGIYNTVLELMFLGHKVRGTGLPRPFYRGKFGELPDLMCLATKVYYHHAVCKVDGKHPATENQRIIPPEYGGPRVPNVKEDPIFFPGDSYEARCLFHHEVKGEDENPYRMERFERSYG